MGGCEVSKKRSDVNLLDINIGKKISELRLAQGISRKKLGDMIGVTHQQCQKYETGANRISAGRLVLIAKVLDKPVDYFYGSFSENDMSDQNRSDKRFCMDVAKNLTKIKSPEYRQALGNLIRTMAKLS